MPRPRRFEVREPRVAYRAETSKVLVDTNVLIDILVDDPAWCDWSSARLAEVIDTAQPLINVIVYAEVAATFESLEALETALNGLSLTREHVPWEAAFLASKAHRLYRRRGGARTTTLSDFFIGAHAAIAGHTLLTRNATRYREYFPKLRLIAP